MVSYDALGSLTFVGMLHKFGTLTPNRESPEVRLTYYFRFSYADGYTLPIRFSLLTVVRFSQQGSLPLLGSLNRPGFLPYSGALFIPGLLLIVGVTHS